VTQKAVLIPVFILPSVMLLILFVTKNFFSFKYQLEEEAGSAEEQPASNKADAYTIVKKGLSNWLLFLYYRLAAWLKKNLFAILSYPAIKPF
jgi:hypothetical protein